MKKILALTSIIFLLAACGSNEESENSNNNDPNAPPEVDTSPVKLEDLETMLHPGTNMETYGLEVQALSDRGRIAVEERVELNDENSAHADIIAAEDGFLAVVNDGSEITESKGFNTVEEAREYLENEY